MICFHNKYTLGDKHNYKEPREAIYDIIAEYMDMDYVDNDYYDSDFIEKYLGKLNKYILILPLYLYDHSGITMNTSGFSCNWDSGQVGWIYVSKDAIRKEFNVKKITKDIEKKAYSLLESEVKNYDLYIRGDVQEFVLYKKEVCPTCGNVEEESIDSCGGFFGYADDTMIKDMIEQLDLDTEGTEEIKEAYNKMEVNNDI